MWKSAKDNTSKKMIDILKSKIKRTFLLKKLDALVSWGEENYKIEIKVGTKINLLLSGAPFNAKISEIGKGNITISPIYIHLAGMGIYYKGIYSMKKYYPNWQLISEAITDFLDDLFIVSENPKITEDSKETLDLFEKFFEVKFYIQQSRIYAKEKRNHIIEKAASGLQTLCWLYLTVKYGLLGEILLIDEPETNLHPEYIDKLSMLLVELSKKRKVFVATHSDYLLESLNKYILKKNLKIDIWVGKLKEKGADYITYNADKENLIDTTPLSSMYLDILREGF